MGVQFDESRVPRIVDAVRYVERMTRNEPAHRRQHLDKTRIYLGKTDAAINKGASGTVSIYGGSTKGSESDTGTNLTGVYNRFGDLDSGKWVHVMWVNGGWELSAGEC